MKLGIVKKIMHGYILDQIQALLGLVLDSKIVRKITPNLAIITIPDSDNGMLEVFIKGKNLLF